MNSERAIGIIYQWGDSARAAICELCPRDWYNIRRGKFISERAVGVAPHSLHSAGCSASASRRTVRLIRRYSSRICPVCRRLMMIAW
jgi:hypothetical protein